MTLLPQPSGDHAHDAVEFAVQAAANAGCIQLNLDRSMNRRPQCAILPSVAGDRRHLLYYFAFCLFVRCWVIGFGQPSNPVVMLGS